MYLQRTCLFFPVLHCSSWTTVPQTWRNNSVPQSQDFLRKNTNKQCRTNQTKEINKQTVLSHYLKLHVKLRNLTLSCSSSWFTVHCNIEPICHTVYIHYCNAIITKHFVKFLKSKLIFDEPLKGIKDKL